MTFPSHVRAVAVSLAVGLVLADSSIAVLALPAIHRELEVELGDLHWALTSFNLALALAAIPAAWLVRGRSPVGTFAAGLLLFAAASAGCALAPSFWALVAFRAVQALGGAAVVVAALELLFLLRRSRRGAVAAWVGAGAVGAAFGPALGGALTETISWQAVFAVQVPLALAPLPFLVGPGRPAAARGRLRQRPRDGVWPRLLPNVALALVSVGIAAALFLVVLLLVEGWELSPIEAAAVMTALPLAALATAPLARRGGGLRARAAAGAILVAGGLAALGLLPDAGWPWTVPPQLLVGAGLALALAALTDTALGEGDPHGLRGAVTIAARHAGVVLGLLLLSPLLVADLDRRSARAEQAGTARLLDSRLSLPTKIELASSLSSRVVGTAGRLPDLDPAFRSIEPAPAERPVVEELERELDEIVDQAVTSAFSRSFLVAAALTLAALVPVVLARRWRR